MALSSSYTVVYYVSLLDLARFLFREALRENNQSLVAILKSLTGEQFLIGDVLSFEAPVGTSETQLLRKRRTERCSCG